MTNKNFKIGDRVIITRKKDYSNFKNATYKIYNCKGVIKEIFANDVYKVKIRNKYNGNQENGYFFIRTEDMKKEITSVDLYKTDKILDVFFNEKKGTTTIKFADGEVITVKTCKGDKFDKQTGILLCIAKKGFGGTGKYLKVLNSCVENGKDTYKSNKKK